jgi:hypothetical protein
MCWMKIKASSDVKISFFSIELKKFGIVILSSFYRVKQTVYEEPVKESSYK